MITKIGFAFKRILERVKIIFSESAIELAPHKDVSWVRSSHFWTITVLIVILTFLYYIGQILLVKVPWLSIFMTEPLDFARTLFSIPVIYAALIFRIKGSLITSFIFLCVTLPRALLISQYEDALLRAIVFVLITLSISLLVALMANRIDMEKERSNLLQFLANCFNKQEEEKKYLARELHDESLQALVDVVHQIDAVKKIDEGEEIKKRLGKLRGDVDYILVGIRQIISGLRPPLLEEMGLAPLLNWLVHNPIAEEQGIEVDIDVSGKTRRLEDTIELNLLRIAQEALQNAKKHSKAKKIKLMLSFTDDKVQLTIRDDGVGFSMPSQEKLAAQMNFGLIGMAERSRLIGGTLKVESSPGNGTTIFVEVPVKSHEPDEGPIN